MFDTISTALVEAIDNNDPQVECTLQCKLTFLPSTHLNSFQTINDARIVLPRFFLHLFPQASQLIILHCNMVIWMKICGDDDNALKESSHRIFLLFGSSVVSSNIWARRVTATMGMVVILLRMNGVRARSIAY